MQSFTFLTANKIIFGENSIAALPGEIERILGDSRDSRDSQAYKNLRDSRDLRDSKDSQASANSPDYTDSQTSRDLRDSKDSQASANSPDYADSQTSRDLRDSKDSQASANSPDYRDSMQENQPHVLIVTGKRGLGRFPALHKLINTLPYQKTFIPIAQEPLIETIEAARTIGQAALNVHQAPEIGQAALDIHQATEIAGSVTSAPLTESAESVHPEYTGGKMATRPGVKMVPHPGGKIALNTHQAPEIAGSVTSAPLTESTESTHPEYTGGKMVTHPGGKIATRPEYTGVKSAIVLGIGGGSVLDSAKALAALIPNRRPITDYLEVIGKGMPLEISPLPVIAIPTTAGTGSEVTKNAVIGSQNPRVKVSLRHDKMLPRLALLDPTLTYSLPFNITAQTGMDALVQVIESFLSPLGTPLTDALAREGIARNVKALPKIAQNPADTVSRADLLFTSLLGGITLANAKLGAVHALAGVLGGVSGAPHGALCGILLSPVLRENYRCLRTARSQLSSSDKHSNESTAISTVTALRKFNDLATLVSGTAPRNQDNSSIPTNQDDSPIYAMIDTLEALTKTLKLPKLSALGVHRADFPYIAAQSTKASSMKGNPIQLSEESLKTILNAAY